MKTEEAATDPKRTPANDGQIIPKRQQANHAQTPARKAAESPHHNHAQKPKSCKASEARKDPQSIGTAEAAKHRRKRNQESRNQETTQHKPHRATEAAAADKIPAKSPKARTSPNFKATDSKRTNSQQEPKKSTKYIDYIGGIEEEKFLSYFSAVGPGLGLYPWGVSKSVAIFLKRKNFYKNKGGLNMELFKEYGITKEEMLNTADDLIELYEKYGEIYDNERLETFKGVLIALLKDYTR